MILRNVPNPLCQALLRVLLLVCVAAFSGLLPATAVAASEAGSGGDVTKEQIEAGRKAAESDTTLDETQKQKALEQFDQAGQWLQQATETGTRLTQLQNRVNDAPQRIESIRSGKAASEMTDIASILEEGGAEKIELALANEQLALQQARESQSKQADELARLLVGSKELSEAIAKKSDTLAQIDKDLEATPTGEPEALVRSRTLVLKSRRLLLQTDLGLLKLRLGNHDLLTNLAQSERDLATAEIAARKERLDALGQAAQKAREAVAREARVQAEALEDQTEALPPALRSIARDAASYRLELEKLVSREQATSRDLQSVRLGLDETKGDFERTQRRVEVVGATEVIGKMLERRRDQLPSLQSYRRTSANRAEEIDQATDRQIEIDELLWERGDIPAVVASALATLPTAQRPVYEKEAEQLARTRRDALNELQKVSGRYIAQLTALDLAERQLVEVASAYIDYIDDQLVWIPGPGITTLLDPALLGKGLVWLLAPGHWAELVRDAQASAGKRPVAVLLVLGLCALMLRKRKTAGRRLSEISREVCKIRTDSFKLTLKALAYTLIIAGAWPLLLIGGGWLLKGSASAAPFTQSVGNGLMQAGLILFSLSLLIQLCRPDGLGDRHLRWPQTVRDALVHELRWILPIAVVLGFLVAATVGNEPPREAQNLGRLAFTFLMLASVVFLFRLLRRRGAIMESALKNGGVLGQLHFLWFPLVVILPMAFAVSSAVGYYYTALHLEQRAEYTFWLFVDLFLLKELLLRSLYVAERHLRFDDALRRREELRAQRAQGDEEHEEGASPIPIEIPEINFDQLSEQNKRLLRAGFLFGAVIGIWSIWSDLLPALGFLYSTELPLHASRIVDGIAKEVPVTLGDLVIGFIMVLITVLAAKNIPGVLEIALLQRLPLDSGARYAIKALSQYTIAGVGVFAAFSTLGLQWSSIQWLVAALSVGLGFGLQEIVANFISGIILLFERPIRVGDVVTLDSTTGVVSRIRIRATTITNWDKQELLIPNKEFITGRVINWTLSDKINRVVIPVGVAYGSDVQRAMDLLLESASENENILKDPKPVASFEAFGDNALTLLLRAYLGSMDNRLATITALHQAINQKFAAAGIEISFPQRDIHLDTSRPLDIRLHRAPADIDPQGRG